MIQAHTSFVTTHCSSRNIFAKPSGRQHDIIHLIGPNATAQRESPLRALSAPWTPFCSPTTPADDAGEKIRKKKKQKITEITNPKIAIPLFPCVSFEH
jgi:hypothetical protein